MSAQQIKCLVMGSLHFDGPEYIEMGSARMPLRYNAQNESIR